MDAIRALKELANSEDVEAAHSKADKIIIKFLKEAGLTKLANAYIKVPKWYA